MVTGCRTQRESTRPLAESDRELFERIAEQALPFHTLSARMDVDLDLPGQQLGSRVELRMVRDSALQLSVQPLLGIEMFRLLLTTDSVKVIDRMNKRYLAEDYGKLRGQTPIAFNYYNLQALLLGQLFLPGEQEVAPARYRRFRVSREGSIAELRTEDAAGLHYLFRTDGEGKLLATDIRDGGGGTGMYWRYADHRLADTHPYPATVEAQLFTRSTARGSATFRYARLKTDTPVTLDGTLPAKYKRVTFEQILRSLIKLQQP